MFCTWDHKKMTISWWFVMYTSSKSHVAHERTSANGQFLSLLWAPRPVPRSRSCSCQKLPLKSSTASATMSENGFKPKSRHLNLMGHVVLHFSTCRLIENKLPPNSHALAILGIPNKDVWHRHVAVTTNFAWSRTPGTSSRKVFKKCDVETQNTIPKITTHLWYKPS